MTDTAGARHCMIRSVNKQGSCVFIVIVRVICSKTIVNNADLYSKLRTINFERRKRSWNFISSCLWSGFECWWKSRNNWIIVGRHVNK